MEPQQDLRAISSPIHAMAVDVPFPRRGTLSFAIGVLTMRIGRASQWVLVVITAANLLAGTAALAQTASTSDSGRRVKTKVAPVYPELARRMSVVGKVKLEVVITPDGRVKSTRVIGGHPILVQACQDAIKDWKFMPAPEESTQVVEFDFHEQQ